MVEEARTEKPEAGYYTFVGAIEDCFEASLVGSGAGHGERHGAWVKEDEMRAW